MTHLSQLLKPKYLILFCSFGILVYIFLLRDDNLYNGNIVKNHNFRSLRYWERSNSINESIWPRPTSDKYLTFKSWGAGFNNERISLELAFSFAFLLNRTLVLPPKYRHYNLKEFAYEDFFELSAMRKALPVLTFQEFQEISGVKDDYLDIDKMAYVLNWPDMPHTQGIFVFPKKPDRSTEPDKWRKMMDFATPRRQGIIRDIQSDPQAQTHQIVHFPHHQLFSHFYAHIHVTDPVLDKYFKRVVRDHVHIRTDIFDEAFKIIRALPNDFYTIHIRRGDFQYPNQRYLKGEDIFKNIENLIPAGATLYVATDEKNMDAFDAMFLSVFRKKWKVVTYDNYKHILEGTIPSNWIGLIEQIICSRGKIFVGTKMSTYSGYITRLRGYMPDIENKEIYFSDTKFPDQYNDPLYFNNAWPTWKGYWIEAALWAREFKESWEID